MREFHVSSIFQHLKARASNFRGIAPLFAARLIIVMSGIATVKLQAMVLAPRDIGLVSLTVTCVSGVVMLLVSPVGNFVTRYAHPWILTHQIHSQLATYLRFLLGLALLACIVAYAGTLLPFLDSNFLSLYTILVVIVSSILATPLTSAIVGCHLVTGNTRLYSILASVQALIIPATIGLLIYVSGKNTADMWLLGQGLAPLWVLIASGLSLRAFDSHKHSTAAPDLSPKRFILKEIWPFAAPLVIGIVAWWGQTQLFRVSLATVAGTEKLGLIAVAFSVAFAPLVALESVLSDLYMPKWLQKLSSTKEKVVRKRIFADVMWQPLLLLSFATVFVVLFSRSLLVIFASTQYQDSSQYIVYACLAFLAQHLFKNANLYFHGEEQTQSTVLPALAGLGVSCIFMYLGYQFDVLEPVLLATILGPFIGFGLSYTKGGFYFSELLKPLLNMGHGFLWSLPLIAVKLGADHISCQMPLWDALTKLMIGSVVSFALVLLMLKKASVVNAKDSVR